jgi:hypothetical protein
MQNEAFHGDGSGISRPRVGRPGRMLGWLLLLVLAVLSIWWIDRQAIQTNHVPTPGVATEGNSGQRP